MVVPTEPYGAEALGMRKHERHKLVGMKRSDYNVFTECQ